MKMFSKNSPMSLIPMLGSSLISFDSQSKSIMSNNMSILESTMSNIPSSALVWVFWNSFCDCSLISNEEDRNLAIIGSVE
ncbi:hypothetical protein OGAPHI_002579 [Ogataea philodendri]|uniref:Uncharacterized protein n=1 Tax=Ogataea philodendri TaxID=1378263 RepID=A0A9P8T7U4_9ASCO|nr:uncharacterized protein OGAPHI_002579 [Ogataea philodendri]KAH3668824.1 hypothetical protein OGAPHI_002579 [Ogataea philodendri]